MKLLGQFAAGLFAVSLGMQAMAVEPMSPEEIASLDIDALKKMLQADPVALASESIKAGRIKFLSVAGFSIDTPGIDTKKCGVKGAFTEILPGTSDVVKGDEHLKLIIEAREFARRHNLVMKKHLLKKNGLRAYLVCGREVQYHATETGAEKVKQLRWVESAAPILDAKKAIENGNFSLLGVAGYTVTIPGVDESKKFEYREKYGLRILEGTTGPAHGGPHWDVESPGGGYRNVRPRR